MALEEDPKSFDIHIAAECPETLVDFPYLNSFSSFHTEEKHLRSPLVRPGIFFFFFPPRP